MSFESETSFAAFDEFATAATLDGADLASGAIVDQDVEVVDETGDARYIQAIVHMKKTEGSGWSRGDLVDHDSGKFRLQEIVKDDGIILQIAAVPTPSA